MPQNSGSRGASAGGRVSVRKLAPKGTISKKKMEMAGKKKKISAAINNNIENQMRKRLAQDGGVMRNIKSEAPSKAGSEKLKFKPRAQNKKVMLDPAKRKRKQKQTPSS
ncbi:hypothetical protein FVE85_0839 [Porphyridium purpureum]|uniref:Uncharacterized protein n=1 Tax=Porphyridium purpureum TaxID=35688 RepID=A0A5J4Z1F7_PORPP|nr:hypothetical protein FVE85_0839 [Porphyridium purpureum]|eukprot:POR6604..scf208_2